MSSTLIQILRWLMQEKVWRFVGFASSLVGLACFALSSSFNHLFGRWNLLKIFLYTIFSFIICLLILYAKIWQHSRSLRFKAHAAFLVLTITSVYSFFFDKVINGKPDAYSIISCASFAIMSLSLSRQIQCGFEVDLLYFFLGCLTVLLMKIKLPLFIIGAAYSYSLIILRSFFSSIDATSAQIWYAGLGDENSVVIEVIDSPQPPITDSIASIMEQLRTCLNALQQENSNLIEMLLKKVKEYLENDSELELFESDPNFMIDALPLELINDLEETAKLMVRGGFEKECSEAYISCRRKYLEECLINKLFGSLEIIVENEAERVKYVDTVIRRWTTASEVALRILFPFERQLCEQVFSGFSTTAAHCFTEICQGATFQLLSFADAVADGIPSTWRLFKMIAIFETLRFLIKKFRLLFPDSLVNETAVAVQNRLGEATRDLFVKLNYKIFGVPESKQVAPADGQCHPMTGHIMSYVVSACRSRQTLEQIFQDYPRDSNRHWYPDQVSVSLFSFTGQMEWVMEKLERYLIAKSKNYEDLALPYIFMMNNRWYIEAMNKTWEFGTIFGDRFFQKNRAKIQDLELYLRSSWNKVLDFLNLDSNQWDTEELLRDKLNLFNMNFEKTCRVRSTWSVDKKLADEITVSVGNTLLPEYGIFIGRFRDLLGIHANKYIKYGMFEIQNRLNNLFLQQ